MKKALFFLTAILLISAVDAGAQNYKQNKTKYDFRSYQPQVGDPYNPGVAGVTSFLIPGLGQMISNEGGRGAAFLGGYAGCLVIYGAGVGSMVTDGSGSGLALVGLAGALTVNIWSIVDAVRVAKVNNMAWQDRQSSSFRMQPGMNVTPGGEAIPSLTMAWRF